MERDDTVIKYPMYDTMYYFKNEPNTAFISNAVLILPSSAPCSIICINMYHTSWELLSSSDIAGEKL